MMKSTGMMLAFFLALGAGCSHSQNASADKGGIQAPSESTDIPDAALKDAAGEMPKNAQPVDSPKEIDPLEIADWCRPGMSDPISAKAWAEGNNAFGVKFLRQTRGNTVFSPYSIERALGMVLDGACGSTANEMLAALELPDAKRLSLSGLEVDRAMKAVNQDTLLEIENTLWPDQSLTLPEDYLTRISEGYQNRTSFLNYKANPESARNTINDAIEKKTHDRIKELIPKGNITTLTKLVITNAVYFKSKWFDPFEESDTVDGDFYNSDKKIQTKIMHRTESGAVCIGKDFASYDLRFRSEMDPEKRNDQKGAFVMRIILPTIDDQHPMEKRTEQLGHVEKLLTADLTENCKWEPYDRIFLSMPRFKLAPETMSIKQKLESLGMKKAFTEFAEFYAMPDQTPKPDTRTPYLRFSDVFHKAFIEIDEKGGEAAAATAVVMQEEGIEPIIERPQLREYHFTVDHPFLFMIIEQSTNAAIFMGRVTDL